jgi:branched-chain amino acid transport system permease protein
MLAYLVTIATGVVIYAVQALGMNIQWGWAGLLNLSFIGFVGLGGYISSFFTLPPSSNPEAPYWFGLQKPFLLGVAAAMIVCGLVALALGAVALRKLRTDYFAIVTLCFYTMLYQVVGTFTPFAGGFVGIYGVPQPFSSVLGTVGNDYYPEFFLALCLVILVALYFFCQHLQRSPFGRTLRAVREDPTAASVFGRNVYVFKLKAFVLGATFAGLGGALTAAWIGAYSPGSWTSAETFLILATVLLGGTASNRGSILGAVLITGVITELVALIPNLPFDQSTLQEVRLILFGVLILAVIRFRPRGIISEPRDRDYAPQPKAVSESLP